MGQEGLGQASVRNLNYDQIPNLGLRSLKGSSEGLLGAASLNVGRGSTGPRRRCTGVT